jgi:CubicO group peptidase (beta-lactamase class C family)
MDRETRRAGKGKSTVILLGLVVAGFFSGCATFGGRLQTGAPSQADEITGYQELVSSVDAFLLEATDSRVPGVAVVFFEFDRLLLSGGYGMRDSARELAVRRETRFQVASISKTLTGIAVMDLVESGVFALDAAARDYVEGFRLPESEFGSQEVTVRRLLSHSAGLSLHGYPGFPPDSTLPTTAESLEGRTGKFLGIYPVGGVEIAEEPGTRFRYSGGGYTLLQLMIEEGTGMPFDQYMDEHVLPSLALSHSTFDTGAVDPELLATPYSPLGRELPNYVFAAKAAAGLYTTADDLARVLQDVLRGYLGSDGQFLKPETYREMLSPVMQIEPDLSIGLSFFLEELEDGTVFAHHGGGNRGWRSFYGVNLQSGEGMVILTNSDVGHNRIVSPILEAYRTYRAGLKSQ